MSERPQTHGTTDQRSKPPVPLIGRALEPLYRAVLARRNAAFDKGTGVTRFDVPVISVGNLSVGGTGKTPTVRTIVERLLARGRSPVIAMRGYKARDGRPSDEQREYLNAFPNVPVVAQPDRAAGLNALRDAGTSFDAIVLDDGFQHRRIARDLDIVLIDCTRPPFGERCLPAGWLREPVPSLARTELFVLTRSDQSDADAITRRLTASYPRTPIARSSHAWTGFVRAAETLPADAMRGRRVLVACAIGHPSAFVRQAEHHGAAVVDSVVMPDHHDWSASDARTLGARARELDALVLTTEKDWVKLNAHVVEAMRFVRPVLRMAFDPAGDKTLDHALDSVLG